MRASSRPALILTVAAGLLFGRVGRIAAQDTARVMPPLDSAVAGLPTSSVHRLDTVHASRLEDLERRTVLLGRRSLTYAREAERVVFDADSTVAQWSVHDDPVSRALRRLSPVAFWVPIAAVAAVPVIWADEAQDGHGLNAAYARNATAGVALGLVASRITKHFVHRARPCTGEAPGDISVRRLADSLPQCPPGSHVRSYASFFSEHTMVLFAIASSMTFQAQRRSAPNAALVAGVSFPAAAVLSIGRIYEHHHWLTDVLVGAGVGTACGFLAAQLAPSAAPH